MPVPIWENNDTDSNLSEKKLEGHCHTSMSLLKKRIRYIRKNLQVLNAVVTP